ncbi:MULTISPECIES: GAF domain-containing protein [unclassified Nostoc]|uniref:GAF domain-containing sensor histidine kinase n=1 Tax=unclassified Nostoc TaxID=2593658 RepID=UPI0025AB51F8|nr:MULTISPECIES: GAF domain-containing protein [unclassified Nostoc]MDM9586191.1 GAF domain-containing protein [Nostoc sp. GT001]MDZ7948301.1 GAF domain-containing protein [Nostoc sp. EfeVER01]MDZ7990884.1 GAF domain-containing protein [Nostoc sp. EspVER01]
MEPNSNFTENQLLLSSAQLQEQLEQQKALASVIVRIRESLDLEKIFQTTVTQVRQLLNADRVAVFQFDREQNWEGEFVSEDVAIGWDSAMTVKVYDHCFGEQFAASYQQGRVQAVADIFNAGLSDCHLAILSKFQVQANLVVPLSRKQELWGLLCIHQCSETREWKESEIEFIRQIADHLVVAIQQAKHLHEVKLQATKLAQAVQRDQVIAKIVDEIRSPLDIETIFKTTTQEIRKLLQADRVAIFSFNPDWSGNFVAESFTSGWTPLVGVEPAIADTYLQQTQGGRYVDNQTFIVNDIYQAGLTNCHVTLLEQFQAKAFATAPILQGDQLWGIIAAYQNASPREWESYEVESLIKIGTQIGVAVRHHKLLAYAQYQAEQQKTLTSVITRIRESLDLDTIFQTTVTEARQMLQADRVAVFRFDPQKDWEGEFISEDFVPECNSVMAEKVYDYCFGENFAHLYAQGRVNAIADIYQGKFPGCYVQILEKFQVRANMVAPLLKKGELWGLLCIHQCTAPRYWQSSEIEFASQIAEQLGVALKQDSYLKQVQMQVVQLAEATEREKAMERQELLAATIDKIRQSLDIKTIFRTTTQAVRELLEVERIAIYRFNPDWSGKFVADSFKDGWKPVVQDQPMIIETFEDTDDDNELPRNETFVPIREGEKLWGLLVAYQNSQPRYWKEEEINLLAQVGVQLGIAIQQAELLEQTKRQTLELSQTLQELKQTQTRLIQGEKMAGLGQLLAGVAHEINNPISFIFGNLIHLNEYTEELLKVVKLYRQSSSILPTIQEQIDKSDLDFLIEDLPKTLESMKVGTERICDIVLSLRNFSRTDEAELKPVDIHEGLDSTLLILGHRLKNNNERPAIEIIKQYDNLPLLECYPAQLNQVFMNLLSNSIDALEEKFNTIQQRYLKLLQTCPRIPLTIWINTQTINNQIVIRIADNGLGIPEEVRSHIFDPFFTTKAPGKGTGLGLSISHQIVVEKHHGQMKCSSKPGEGTEFLIEIPCGN